MDRPEYWEAIAKAVSPAKAILLFGHGKGKGNASSHFAAYLEKHRRDVAAKVVANLRIDLDRLDDRQILRLGQYYFDGPPVRDLGRDVRQGPPHYQERYSELEIERLSTEWAHKRSAGS